MMEKMRQQLMEWGLSGMSCASCVTRVQNALQSVPGVTQARVNLAQLMPLSSNCWLSSSSAVAAGSASETAVSASDGIDDSASGLAFGWLTDAS